MIHPIGLTMCSGIGAPEMAAPWVDWRLGAEIEPFPREVLMQRYGYLPPDRHQQGAPYLHSDMAEVGPELLRARGLPLPDLVVAGTPCQAFSVAGARKGLEDARGNLTLKFVEILHELVAVRPDGKLSVLWENVPGVLSDKGNAFGCFLGGVVGAMDAIVPSPCPAPGRSSEHWKWHKGGRHEVRDEEGEPSGEFVTVEPHHALSWPSEGMVEGPWARAAWAVLDAQWFGVAQRRRRVFVVVDFGGSCDPAAVLLEPDSLRGDSPPRRGAGPGVAAITSSGVGTCGADDNQAKAGHLIRLAHGQTGAEIAEGVAPSMTCNHEAPIIAHSLRGEGFDASEDGMGRGTPIVPVAAPIAFDSKGTGVQFTEDGSHPPLRSMGHSASHQNAGGHAAVAFAQNQRGEIRVSDISPQLTCGDGKPGAGYPAVQAPWAVRRLTTRECARLQGFPDDHTEISWKGKTPDQTPDGPQYKAYGNSMAVPVMRWILERMAISAGWSTAHFPHVKR